MVKYLSPIDPHVHLRGEEYPDSPFLEWGFQDAKEAGLIGLIEQPNPKPWLTSKDIIERRLITSYKSTEGIVHRAHIGLTKSPQRVKNALVSIMRKESGLSSDKIFYVNSTGNMGILDEDYQRWIWNLKGQFRYNGVSVGHFEDEKGFTGVFDPIIPITHSLNRPSNSETTQVQRQIKNARDSKFNGVFYIAHCSSPDTIDFIESERKKLSFNVAIEMTFHHTLLNWKDYQTNGNRVKMNPPLRSPEKQEKLLDYFIGSKIPDEWIVIGTDHAPHPIERKDDLNNPASGIPAIPFWPRAIEIYRNLGISEERLRKATFYNSNRIFQFGLNPVEVEVKYNLDLWNKYGYNPFSRKDTTN